MMNILAIFGQNWYFLFILEIFKSKCFQIWYVSTLAGSLSDSFISCQNLELSFLWWIFLPFLVKNDIFHFFFKTTSQIASKFDIQLPWVVLSQICSFRVKISNFLFLVSIFVIFDQNWYFWLLQNRKSSHLLYIPLITPQMIYLWITGCFDTN